MKERPILFSGPMVRAILEGRKTQTRRIVKPQPELTRGSGFSWKGHVYGQGADYAGTVRNFVKWTCPYGHPGDRLWVRETCLMWRRMTDGKIIEGESAPVFRDDPEWASLLEDGKWLTKNNGKKIGWVIVPSIHMPRFASRITLQVTCCRVERLQDISEEDAKAEGVEEVEPGMFKSYADQNVGWSSVDRPKMSYQTLWESINGPGSWDANPWVWVIEFKRVTGEGTR